MERHPSLTLASAIQRHKFQVNQPLKLIRYLHLGLNTLKGGDSVAVLQAGLPNILGAFSEGWNDGTEATNSLSGAVYAKSQSMRLRSADGIGNWNRRLSFDASRSSGIYGASTTVQPPALQLILQIRY